MEQLPMESIKTQLQGESIMPKAVQGNGAASYQQSPSYQTDWERISHINSQLHKLQMQTRGPFGLPGLAA